MKKMKSICYIGLIFLLLLVGCKKETESNPLDKEVSENEIVPVEWNTVVTTLPDKYEKAMVEGDKLYACNYEEEGVILTVFQIEPLEIISTYEFPELIEVKSIFQNEKEEICLFASTQEESILYTISQEGEISSINDIIVEDMGLYPELVNMYGDSEGYYYLLYHMTLPVSELEEDGEEDTYRDVSRIYVKDQQMNTLRYENISINNRRLRSVLEDEKGAPIFLIEERDVFSDCTYYLENVSKVKGETNTRSKIENATYQTFENLGDNTGMKVYNDQFYYINNGGIYKYDVINGLLEKVIDLAIVGIFEEDILSFEVTDGGISIIDNYKKFDTTEYMVIKEGESNRKELSIGVMSLSEDLEEIIGMYNRNQNEVRITPKIYAENYDYEAGYQQLTFDIIQGIAPDLMNVSGIQDEHFAKKGAFLDLYKFMETDTEVTKDTLVESVREVYEVDHKLYCLSPSFGMVSMLGASSVVQGKQGISMSEMITLLEEQGKDINNINGFSDDEPYLTTFCAFNLNKFIDWETGQCDFISGEFGEILEFVKAYEGNPIDSYYGAFQNKEIMFKLAYINSVEEYVLYEKKFGEEVEFIGYPTASGTGTAAFYGGESLAINGTTEAPEEAWEFLKFYVQNGYNGTFFPMEKEKLEKLFEESLQETMIEEFGEMVAIPKTSYSESRNNVYLKVYKCEEEDVEVIRDLIDGVSDLNEYNIEIQKIIDEEASAYLEGPKSVEEVCEIIQNRIQLYVDELE